MKTISSGCCRNTPLSRYEKVDQRERACPGDVYSEDFGLPMDITCSFGVAEYIQGEPLDSFVNRADERLYKAKSKGKNTVVANGAA